MSLIKASFRMPTPVKITGRTSSITNSFVNAIIPVVEPTENQIARALEILEIDLENPTCAYCGDRSTEWDHLNPLVSGKQPTGYISEIENLVPACGKCNQSKGNKPWRDWMRSDARLSPKTRGIVDLEQRIQVLQNYEAQNQTRVFDFAKIVGKEKWSAYWLDRDKIFSAMRDAQRLADEIRTAVHEAAK
jgi:endonuclease I